MQVVGPLLPSHSPGQGRRFVTAGPGAVSARSVNPCHPETSVMISVTSAERTQSARQIHIIGAGPVGLFLTALLESVDGLGVRLYEKRAGYQRTRMVRLASSLAAGSSGNTDRIDSENIEAVFEPHELEANLAFKQSVPPDLMSRLSEWTQGFCPLNTIERSLSGLIDERGSGVVERVATALTVDDVL